jgi:hypothetical protein
MEHSGPASKTLHNSLGGYPIILIVSSKKTHRHCE